MNYQWKEGDWAACSVSCGGGTQTVRPITAALLRGAPIDKAVRARSLWPQWYHCSFSFCCCSGHGFLLFIFVSFSTAPCSVLRRDVRPDVPDSRAQRPVRQHASHQHAELLHCSVYHARCAAGLVRVAVVGVLGAEMRTHRNHHQERRLPQPQYGHTAHCAVKRRSRGDCSVCVCDGSRSWRIAHQRHSVRSSVHLFVSVFLICLMIFFLRHLDHPA